MLKGRHARLALWSTLLSMPWAACAEGCGPYRVAFYEYGSMYFHEKGQPEGGIDRDVLDEIARRTGCVFTTSVVSRVATWIYMARGQADITMSSIRTPERERSAAFAIYLKGDLTLFVRSELAGTVDSLQTFVTRGKWTLAVTKGFSYGARLDAVIADLRRQGRVAEYSDATAVARVMDKGRADAFLASPLAWSPILKAHPLQDKITAVREGVGTTIEAGLTASRARVAAPDIQRMTQAVADMRADGTLLRILERYGAPDVARRAQP